REIGGSRNPVLHNLTVSFHHGGARDDTAQRRAACTNRGVRVVLLRECARQGNRAAALLRSRLASPRGTRAAGSTSGILSSARHDTPPPQRTRHPSVRTRAIGILLLSLQPMDNTRGDFDPL